VSLYHRRGNALFGDVLRRLGSDPAVRAVVLPRTNEQRVALRDLALPSLVVPERAVEAQSLVALADVVVSAGGTMNREAIALGVPVYTTFAGRIGAVDERLIDEGRLRVLASSRDLPLEKRQRATAHQGRDPTVLLDAYLTALER
jgi:predicted glycosyltransferase